MTKQFTALFGFAALLLQMTACSKTSVSLDRENSQNTQPPSLALQSTADRIADIDRQLAAPLKGTPEDSDRRAALRAERNALTNYDPRVVNRNQFAARNQASNAVPREIVEAQAARDHQQMIDKLKADAEFSKITEERRLQAQRDQWEKEDRLRLRQQHGNYRPEAASQNVYDVQISRDQILREQRLNGRP